MNTMTVADHWCDMCHEYRARAEAAEAEVARLREAAKAFSESHHYSGSEDDGPSCDPQDWAEFDKAFGFWSSTENAR